MLASCVRVNRSTEAIGNGGNELKNYLRHHLDPWSLAVIVLTFSLFIIALFIKGFTHEILLEAGVFLVSIKLIMMSHKNSVLAKRTETQLERIYAAVLNGERKS